MYDIEIRNLNDLPAGYALGAHVSNQRAGWSGYYVLRERDGAYCVAVERGDAPSVGARELDRAMRD